MSLFVLRKFITAQASGNTKEQKFEELNAHWEISVHEELEAVSTWFIRL
jgi:hypothetical protein